MIPDAERIYRLGARSKNRYWMASATCSEAMPSWPAKSAMVPPRPSSLKGDKSCPVPSPNAGVNKPIEASTGPSTRAGGFL